MDLHPGDLCPVCLSHGDEQRLLEGRMPTLDGAGRVVSIVPVLRCPADPLHVKIATASGRWWLSVSPQTLREIRTAARSAAYARRLRRYGLLAPSEPSPVVPFLHGRSEDQIGR